MSEDFAARLTNIQARAVAVAARLDEIAAQRLGHSLGLVEHDEAAIKAVSKLDAEAAALDTESNNLKQAVERIHALEQEARAEIIASDLARRQSEAHQLCLSILATSTECDRALMTVFNLVASRDTLLHKLTATGILQSGYIQRLRSKGCLTAAAAQAQLGNYFEIGYTGPGQKHSLADSASALMRDTAPPPERRRFRLTTVSTNEKRIG